MAKDQYSSAAKGPLVVAGYEDPLRRQDYFWNRKGALWAERGSWDGHAQELGNSFLPRSVRFSATEVNRGGDKHNKLYDNTGLRGVRTFAAGMQSGMTSPARQWMRLKHADEELMKYEPVKLWCSQVTRMILDVCAASNIYGALHHGYTQLGVFGTAASLIMPHPTKVVHATSMSWGEYSLATNGDGDVDTIYREFPMQALAIVRAFGEANVSQQVRNAYERGQMDVWFTIVHAIEPNMDYDPRYLDNRRMAFNSVYFEQSAKKGEFLRQSGFKRFRGLTPRWIVNGSDVYGESPGMEALGDAKQLQHAQLRKAQGIDYQTKPPVGLPASMKGQEVDMLPGGVTYFDAAQSAQGQRQLFDVRLDLSHLLVDIQDVRGRINAAFYADLFLMISQIDAGSSRMTATEVAERHEEKLLMLGPALERLQNESVAPLIDMIFEQLMDAGRIPPPPPELEGQPMQTELLGILAQAQRAVEANTLDRFGQGLATVAQFKPEVLDKINGDEWVEAYGDSLAVTPRIWNDDRQVNAIRQQRAQAQQAAQEEAAATQAADNAAKLGGVTTAGGASNAGADVINMFSGYRSTEAERV